MLHPGRSAMYLLSREEYSRSSLYHHIRLGHLPDLTVIQLHLQVTKDHHTIVEGYRSVHRRVRLWWEIHESTDDAVFSCECGRVLGVGLVLGILNGHREALGGPWDLKPVVRKCFDVDKGKDSRGKRHIRLQTCRTSCWGSHPPTRR